jgi:hypothetical protein
MKEKKKPEEHQHEDPIARYADQWREGRKIAWGAFGQDDIVQLLKDFSVALRGGPPHWVETLIATAPAQILQFVEAINAQKAARLEAQKKPPLQEGLEVGQERMIAAMFDRILESRPDINERVMQKLTVFLEENFPETETHESKQW